jgi:hypothetical protein
MHNLWYNMSSPTPHNNVNKTQVTWEIIHFNLKRFKFHTRVRAAYEI